MPRRAPTLVLVGALLVGCASADPDPVATSPATVTPSPSPSTTAPPSPSPTSPAPSSTSPSALPPPTPTGTSTSPPDPGFTSSVAPVAGTPVADRITGSSWREGCPVGLDDLRYLTLRHHTPDGGTAMGELVVHADVVGDVLTAFAQLYELGFPIERMELVDAHGADDQTSMRANNTSGFNCRYVAGTERWSNHASGTAIDINPLWNPWVRGGEVDPPEGAPWADRSVDQPGMLRPGTPEVAAFTDLGWDWGGTWSSAKDYQHVSATGG